MLKNKMHGKIVLILLVLSIFLISGCSETKTIQQKINGEDANPNIKIYNNQFTGISLKYPSNWALEPSEYEGGDIIYPEYQPASNFRTNILTNSFEVDTSLFGDDKFLKDYMNNKRLAYQQNEYYTTDISEEIEFLGTKGYFIRNKKEYIDHTTAQIVVAGIKDNRLYELVFSAEEEYFEDYLVDFDNVIQSAGTFPIKEEVISSESVDYVNELEGYSISYPSEWDLKEVLWEDEEGNINQVINIAPKVSFTPYKVESVTINVLEYDSDFLDMINTPPRSYKEFLEIGIEAEKEVYGYDIPPIEEITVSGLKGYKIIRNIERDDYNLKQTEINVMNGKKNYMIVASLSDTLYKKYSDEVDAIIASFKLV